MKKIWSVCICLVMLSLTCVIASASSQPVVNVNINNKLVEFTTTSGVPFLDENKRTQVPLRATMEAAGATVSWDEVTQTATVEASGTIVKVPVGANYIMVNGSQVDNDTQAVVVNGRTYLPIRAVLESFGFSVEWNNGENTVYASNADEVNAVAPEMVVKPESSEFSQSEIPLLANWISTDPARFSADYYAGAQWDLTDPNNIIFVLDIGTDAETIRRGHITDIYFGQDAYDMIMLPLTTYNMDGTVADTTNFYYFKFTLTEVERKGVSEQLVEGLNDFSGQFWPRVIADNTISGSLHVLENGLSFYLQKVAACQAVY